VTAAAGTPLCMAPEVLARRPYSFECDLWSFGVLLHGAGPARLVP
jgi:serine/threonine protein kinase